MASNDGTFVAGTFGKNVEMAYLIGEFVARWSLAETSLIMPLIRCTNVTQEVACAMLAASNSTEAKIKIVKAAVENSRVSDSERHEVLAAVKLLEKLCPERNALMHHVWMIRDMEAFSCDYRKPTDVAGRLTGRHSESVKHFCGQVLEAAEAINRTSGAKWVTKEAIQSYRFEKVSAG